MATRRKHDKIDTLWVQRVIKNIYRLMDAHSVNIPKIAKKLHWGESSTYSILPNPEKEWKPAHIRALDLEDLFSIARFFDVPPQLLLSDLEHTDDKTVTVLAEAYQKFYALPPEERRLVIFLGMNALEQYRIIGQEKRLPDNVVELFKSQTK